MFEGTGIYFFLLFLILFIVYLTVKICLGKLFKEMKIPAWKAYIPFYCTLILTDILDIKKSVFYKSLIPIVNLYYYKIIIAELLKAYQLNPKEAIWFVIFPMYKFPELVFKNPKFMLHMYDDTEQFLSNQNILFETTPEDLNQSQIPNQAVNQTPNLDINQVLDQTTNQVQTPNQVNGVVINPSLYNQIDNTVKEEPVKIGRTCPECGSELVKRKSRYGNYFIGCSGYPKCHYIENIEGEKRPFRAKRKTK